MAWLEDFGSTLDQAKQSNKPIMIDFYTTWCVYCRKLEKDAFGDARVIELSKQFVPARLDAEVHKTAATRYRPEGFPVVLFLTPTGQEILRVQGYKTADQLLLISNEVLRVGPVMAENLARVSKNKKDYAAHEALGSAYLTMGLGDKAEPHLAQALKSLPVEARTAPPGAESDEARLQFLIGQASAADKDYKKASATLEKLIDTNPTSPRCADYYRELERIYTDWGKTSEAETTRAKRVEACPETAQAPSS